MDRDQDELESRCSEFKNNGKTAEARLSRRAREDMRRKQNRFLQNARMRGLEEDVQENSAPLSDIAMTQLAYNDFASMVEQSVEAIANESPEAQSRMMSTGYSNPVRALESLIQLARTTNAGVSPYIRFPYDNDEIPMTKLEMIVSLVTKKPGFLARTIEVLNTAMPYTRQYMAYCLVNLIAFDRPDYHQDDLASIIRQQNRQKLVSTLVDLGIGRTMESIMSMCVGVLTARLASVASLSSLNGLSFRTDDDDGNKERSHLNERDVEVHFELANSTIWLARNIILSTDNFAALYVEPQSLFVDYMLVFYDFAVARKSNGHGHILNIVFCIKVLADYSDEACLRMTNCISPTISIIRWLLSMGREYTVVEFSSIQELFTSCICLLDRMFMVHHTNERIRGLPDTPTRAAAMQPSTNLLDIRQPLYDTDFIPQLVQSLQTAPLTTPELRHHYASVIRFLSRLADMGLFAGHSFDTSVLECFLAHVRLDPNIIVATLNYMTAGYCFDGLRFTIYWTERMWDGSGSGSGLVLDTIARSRLFEHIIQYVDIYMQDADCLNSYLQFMQVFMVQASGQIMTSYVASTNVVNHLKYILANTSDKSTIYLCLDVLQIILKRFVSSGFSIEREQRDSLKSLLSQAIGQYNNLPRDYVIMSERIKSLLSNWSSTTSWNENESQQYRTDDDSLESNEFKLRRLLRPEVQIVVSEDNSFCGMTCYAP